MTPTEPLTPVLTPTPSTPVAVNLLAEPTFEECQAEWIRYHDDEKSGRFNDWDLPEGHFVAYYDGRLIDHDADPVILRSRVATTLGVHPARLVIDYPWMW